MTKLLLSALTVVALGATATNATTNQRWDHYRSRLSGNTVIIKGTCIQGEDSAAHLKLIAYDDGGGRVVYGCYRHGY